MVAEWLWSLVITVLLGNWLNQFSGQLASIMTLKDPDSLSFLTLITKFQSLLPFGRGTQQQFPPKYIEHTFLAIQSTLRSLWNAF